MGRHSRRDELSPEEAQRIADAAMGLTPADQRAAVGAAFEGSARARQELADRKDT